MVKNPPANAGDASDVGSIPGFGRSPGKWQPTPVFLPGKFHEQKSLVGYSPWGHKESETDEHACTTQWFFARQLLESPGVLYKL